MKLAIMGGTFNPVHFGHLRPAEEIRERLKLDKVLFIPSARPPHKDSEIIEPFHRLEMTRLAVKSNPHFDVSTIEVMREGKSYSVRTVEELLEKYRAELFFLVGIDAFLEIPTWREAERLFALTNLVILLRPPYLFQSLSQSPYLKSISKSVLSELDQGIKQGYRKVSENGKSIYFERITFLDISSTSIRRNLKTGKSIKYLLPDSVESYIMTHGLYR
ncbi:MAG: nicotinate-nucleotide adenylyltransferase [Nitrospirota bacterium]